jgi:hypothetical protein
MEYAMYMKYVISNVYEMYMEYAYGVCSVWDMQDENFESVYEMYGR